MEQFTLLAHAAQLFNRFVYSALLAGIFNATLSSSRVILLVEREVAMVGQIDSMEGHGMPHIQRLTESRTSRRMLTAIAMAAVIAGFTFTLHAAPPTDAPNKQFVHGRLLVKFKNDVTANGWKERQALEATGTSVISRMHEIGVAVVRTPLNANEHAVLNTLKNRPEVEFAELDEIFQGEAVPNDPQFANEWHLSKINAAAAWNYTIGSDSVIIAILDTGINANHPDLAAKIVQGWNTYDNTSNTSDATGHGTKVAGAAAAATDNATGIASIGWNCKIMPMRVTDSTGCGTFSAMASALVWAANKGARVANASYKVSTSSTVTSAAQYFANAGGVMVASAGNDHQVVNAPLNPWIITVSATASNDSLASFTNTGPLIDLAAPGVGILTTQPNGGYGSGSGTSFSAPIVAGVAALMKSANPGLTSTEIRDALRASADDLGPAGWDPGYGWGRVNAANAVAMALGSAPPPPAPPLPPPPSADTVSPTASIVAPSGGANISGMVTVTVNVADNVGVVKVELYVDGVLKSTKTSSPFTHKWQSNGASSGEHTLQIKAYDAANNMGESASITVYKF